MVTKATMTFQSFRLGEFLHISQALTPVARYLPATNKQLRQNLHDIVYKGIY